MTAARIPLLDWNGQEFLRFYFVAFAAALIWSLIRRAIAVRRFRVAGAEHSEITDPYELAYLAGGPPRCAQLAVLRLVEAKAVKWEHHTFSANRLVALDAAPTGLTDIERSLLVTILGYGQKGMPVKEVAGLVARQLYNIEAKLAKMGLRPTQGERSGLGFKAALPLVAVFLLGLLKVGIGFSRGRPTGYLIISLIVTFFVLLMVCRAVKRLTPAGEGLLARLRSGYQPIREESGIGDLAMMSMGLALVGPTVLSAYGHPLAEDQAFRQDLRGMGGGGPSSGGCSSGCGGGGGDSGGGGDGGGSGCGGGGCGGCGGGD